MLILSPATGIWGKIRNFQREKSEIRNACPSEGVESKSITWRPCNESLTCLHLPRLRLFSTGMPSPPHSISAATQIGNSPRQSADLLESRLR